MNEKETMWNEHIKKSKKHQPQHKKQAENKRTIRAIKALGNLRPRNKEKNVFKQRKAQHKKQASSRHTQVEEISLKAYYSQGYTP